MIAPDSFKGTVSARDAAAAIAQGWASVHPLDELVQLPMADGGEGTLDAFEAAIPGAVRVPRTVLGPDGAWIPAEWLRLPDGSAIVELALASGLTLLDPLRPFDAHTYGFGELIADAIESGANPLILAIGGSSSTDGGAGALAALGARLLDATGAPIPLGNRALALLERADLSSAIRALSSASVLCDVRNPLLGVHGAAAVFGPQKGAGPGDIPVLDTNLAHFAEVLGGDPTLPGTGAAGGTAFGLLAWGAHLMPGADEIAKHIGLAEALTSADLVITGEGRFDAQSSLGKVAAYVAELADRIGLAAALVAGVIDSEPARFAEAVSLTALSGDPAKATADAEHWLEAAGAALAARFGRGAN